MTYSIQKDDSNIITVTYTGSVNLSERKTAVDETCKLITPSVPVKLLINVRNINNKMSLDEQEYFAAYLASKKELVNAKVATLHNPLNEQNKIINAFAYIEGYRVVDFYRINEAISWLKGDLK